MRFLTVNALIVCQHEMGRVQLRASQEWVTIFQRPVLVDPDPEKRPINGCQFRNDPLGIKPCTATQEVQVGYSPFIRIGGRRICLDTISGFTDGTPPKTIHYKVNAPGQDLVSEG